MYETIFDWSSIFSHIHIIKKIRKRSARALTSYMCLLNVAINFFFLTKGLFLMCFAMTMLDKNCSDKLKKSVPY